MDLVNIIILIVKIAVVILALLTGFAYMTFANPSYARVLYTTTTGGIILAVALFMLALGSFAMAKLATVEV